MSAPTTTETPRVVIRNMEVIDTKGLLLRLAERVANARLAIRAGDRTPDDAMQDALWEIAKAIKETAEELP